jgi:hypothetical protein
MADILSVLTDPRAPLKPEEVHIYGANARRHPITGMCLEQGSGCLPDDIQAALVHIPEIRRQHGEKVAEAAARKLKAHIEGAK